MSFKINVAAIAADLTTLVVSKSYALIAKYAVAGRSSRDRPQLAKSLPRQEEQTNAQLRIGELLRERTTQRR